MNEKFTNAKVEPVIRYEAVIRHLGNNRVQTWTMSKTIATEVIELLKVGYKKFSLYRIGSDRTTTDRTTTYKIIECLYQSNSDPLILIYLVDKRIY